jgi:hypothetical protein
VSDPTIHNKLHIDGDIEAAARQVRSVMETEPPPQRLTFLYFGVFDMLENGSKEDTFGFYVAGGTAINPEDELRSGTLNYFPNHRLLLTSSFRVIKQAALLSPDRRETFEYLVPFGLAGILGKFAVSALQLPLKVYAGFDSGDYARVR